MGLKDAAKKLMAEAGVPVTPGYLGENQDPAFLAERAAEIGYPVLIKAVAGGGGKGMRKVEDAADFADALASCQREASASFGNAHVLIEKYIQRPRHIEVQVFGDTHGNIVHLFERDCSLQRRHQKVIEEAPAPGMDEATREQLCAAAVKAAKAVDYVGAGTIEFIADASEGLRADRIWFMEMNTRLQVEHPVTEEITGVDLVEWQLHVASGEPLPKRQDELSINGWAMEARLYAEDPAKGFLPSIGEIDEFLPGSVFEMPDIEEALEEGGFIGNGPGWSPTIRARCDTGVKSGAAISPFYDPMIAKYIVYGETRNEARNGLRNMLATAVVAPLVTNAGFLFRLLGDEDFAEGDVDTGLIARNVDHLTTRPEPSDKRLAWAALWLARNDNLGPWDSMSGLRLNGVPRRKMWVSDQFDRSWEVTLPKNLEDMAPWIGSVIDECGERFVIRSYRAEGSHGNIASSGTILSPMPGRIIAVEVTQGQSVTKGQKLLTLEAMKMEHSLTAPFDGVVAELNAEAGAQVQVEALLVRIQAAEVEK
jgi:3-methylcrotonyl-CoA carboxylase alpha subunit